MTETAASEGMTAILTRRGVVLTEKGIVGDARPMNAPTGHKARAVIANVTDALNLPGQTLTPLSNFHHGLTKGGTGGTMTLRQSGWRRCCRVCSGSTLFLLSYLLMTSHESLTMTS